MKLIVAGASGFVGSEILRQSLRRPEITSVVALARKPVSAPEGAGSDAAKLKSVVIKDYEHYPDEVKKEFAGAGGCIWTVAITPTKSTAYEFEEVKRVCQTSTLVALKAMHEAGPAKPFRFVYMSGFAAERDQTKTPAFKPEYSLMRGETENQVLAYAAEHKDEIEACVAKPGLITGTGLLRSVAAVVAKAVMSVPNVTVQAISAAMIDQALKGFEKEPLMNDDLARLGKEVLENTKA